MPFIFWIARRFTHTNDQFLSLISRVSIFGVLLGVCALVVVSSVITGFEAELKRVVTQLHGEIIFFSKSSFVDENAELENNIKRLVPEVSHVHKGFSVEMMMVAKKMVLGSILHAFDEHNFKQKVFLIEGNYPSHKTEVVIGQALSRKMNLTIGDSLRIALPYWDKEKSLLLSLTVSGIAQIGMFEYDAKFVGTYLNFAQEILKRPHHMNHFSIYLQPYASLSDVTARLNKYFSYPYRIKDWPSLNYNLFSAIALEKVIIRLILAIIVMVAAFSVTSTLMMLVYDKSREIAILKVMGLNKRQCFWLFCLIGTGIGLLGGLVGVVFGLIFLFCVEKGNFIELPVDIYHLPRLPITIVANDILLIVFFAIFVSFLATLYPAWKVVEQSPLEGIRW